MSLCLLNISVAPSLKITSPPPVATVELDGVPVGTTPFVDLESVPDTFTGTVAAETAAHPASFQPELSLEELVRRTKPAVFCLKGLDVSGSGFFVTETGVIATNAHLARDDSKLLALLPNGAQLPATVVYIDPNLEIALIKVDPPAPNFLFPYLVLADSSLVQQGESVLVIGNRGDALLFSLTKGIDFATGIQQRTAGITGLREASV